MEFRRVLFRSGALLWYRSNAPLRSPGTDVVYALSTLGEQGRDARAALPLVSALLFLVSDALTTKQPDLSKSESLYLSLLRYLEENCQHPVDRQSVSEEFRLHPNSISRLFQVHGHESFNTVLLRLRMRRAEILRSRYRLSMKELSAACGFRDPNYFGRVFRRWFG